MPFDERRQGQRRKLPIRRRISNRRAGVERRAEAAAETHPDRRAKSERRVAVRRAGRDRRLSPGRRGTDRRRDTPLPFAPRHVDRIRQMLAHPGTTRPCPECGASLTVGPSLPRFGVLVREVTCLGCRRSLVLADRATATVLVIEHDRAAREAITNVLTLAGHTVREASDASGGFRAYEAERSDVVLFNMSLPDVDSIDYIRRLVRTYPGIKIVAISGQRRFGTPDPLAAARSLGANQVLRRPFTAPELLKIVEECAKMNQPPSGRPSGPSRSSGSFRFRF